MFLFVSFAFDTHVKYWKLFLGCLYVYVWNHCIYKLFHCHCYLFIFLWSVVDESNDFLIKSRMLSGIFISNVQTQILFWISNDFRWGWGGISFCAPCFFATQIAKRSQMHQKPSPTERNASVVVTYNEIFTCVRVLDSDLCGPWSSLFACALKAGCCNEELCSGCHKERSVAFVWDYLQEAPSIPRSKSYRLTLLERLVSSTLCALTWFLGTKQLLCIVY